MQLHSQPTTAIDTLLAEYGLLPKWNPNPRGNNGHKNANVREGEPAMDSIKVLDEDFDDCPLFVTDAE